jgi:hypothetical protein
MLCDKLTANMSPEKWRDWISQDPAIPYRELCAGLPSGGTVNLSNPRAIFAGRVRDSPGRCDL